MKYCFYLRIFSALILKSYRMTTPSKMVMKIFALLFLSFALSTASYAQTITVSTPSVVATANVCVSTNSVSVYSFRLVSNSCVCATDNFTDLTIRNTGTAVLGTDITNFKLWSGSIGGTLISTMTTGSVFPAFSVAFGHLPGVTTNFFISADIPSGAGGGKTIIIDASPITTADITISAGTLAGAGTASGGTQTILAVPVATTGNTPMCTGGSTITLNDASGGGTWSSLTSSIATVNSGSGAVTPGATQGMGTIVYSNGCGLAAQTTVTVNAAPSGITGTLALCSGSTSTLSDAAANGTWSSTNTTVATVGLLTGQLTAGTAGITTIHYSNNCGTDGSTATTTATVTPITGPSSVCVTTSITLSESAAGGTWSSDNTNDATVDAFGHVNGVLAGSANIAYSNGCGSSTVPITVNAPNAGSLSGPTNVCIGSSIALSDAVTGGAWSSSNTNAATVDGSGNVFGAGTGTTTISYAASSNTCGTATVTYTVNSSAAASAGFIVGPSTMCAGTFTVVTDAAPSGVWSASNTNANISNTGLLTAVTPGVDIISYTVSNACGPVSATLTVNIGAELNAGTITGPNSLCPAGSITLSDNVAGGVWSSTNSSVATITGLGVVHGVSAGTTTISYLMISGCGSLAATYSVTVNATPDPGTISGPSVICTGTFAVLSDAAPGGVWSSSNTSFATVSGGTVSAVGVGSVNIDYTVTNTCG